MPHDEFPDEASDPGRVIAELRGVVRRQRVLLTVSLIINLIAVVRLYGGC